MTDELFERFWQSWADTVDEYADNYQFRFTRQKLRELMKGAFEAGQKSALKISVPSDERCRKSE